MRPLLALGIALLLFPLTAPAQTLAERMEHAHHRQAAERAEAARAERALRRETAAKMTAVLGRVQLDTSFREALEWWTAATRVPVVVGWAAMEREGIDPQTPVAVDLTATPAHRVLAMLARQASAEAELVWDVEPGYVHLMTRAQAGRMPVVAVYDVMDLLMETPDFRDVPSFDLGEVLGGGGSGRGQRRLFGDDAGSDGRERPLTRRERGERLAQLVRDTIEPTLWDERGGTGGHSVRYWNGRLIVRAPKYVQRQIGDPVIVRSVAPRAGR